MTDKLDWIFSENCEGDRNGPYPLLPISCDLKKNQKRTVVTQPPPRGPKAG